MMLTNVAKLMIQKHLTFPKLSSPFSTQFRYSEIQFALLESTKKGEKMAHYTIYNT